MRIALPVVLVLGMSAVSASVASAGVVSGLLASDNTKNDDIQDRSVGYILDFNVNGPGTDDIGWGVVRVDSVNDVSTNVRNRVFMVYSALITSGLPTSTHTWVPDTNTWSLKSLIATVGDISGSYAPGFGPIAALIEAPSDVTFSGVDFDANTNTNSPTVLKSLIGTNLDSATVLATIGLKDSQDYYWLTGTAGGTLTQQAEMSVIQSFLGPLSDWKALFDPFPVDGQDWTDNEVAIKPGTFEVTSGALTDTAPEPDLAYFTIIDSGTYRVNYVPEPSSLVALIGIGLASLGRTWSRRRKA